MSQLKNFQNPTEIFPSGLLAFSINGMREVQITEVKKISFFESDQFPIPKTPFRFDQAISKYAEVNPLAIYTEGRNTGAIDNLPNPLFIYAQEYVSCILTKEGTTVWKKKHFKLDFQQLYSLISNFDSDDYSELESLKFKINELGFDLDYDLNGQITSLKTTPNSP